MNTKYILFNPLSDNKMGEKNAKAIEGIYPDCNLVYKDITQIKDIYSFLSEVPDDAQIIISGGDGTLNRLVNGIASRPLNRELLFFPSGSGNDFLTDIEYKQGTPVSLNRYIENLPTVTVNGETHLFINGIGYGIDGYCCEVGDGLREKSTKPINYASIAIKGLLFHFKPSNARITVDGKTRTYKNVWLAPTMNGRYYGGGMKVTPNQDRLNKDRTLSVAVMFNSGKLKTLMVFPSIFKGEHIKHTEMVEVLTGHDITVEFDNPTALQIDGETIKGVTGYHALSSAVADNGKA